MDLGCNPNCGVSNGTIALNLPQFDSPLEYAPYLDPRVSLGERIYYAYDEFKIPVRQQHAVTILLDALAVKNFPTYEHSLRVGLLAASIGKFLGLDARALFYAGLLHDIGKTLLPEELLDKKSGWTVADNETMRKHVIYGYKIIKGIFDFSAEIILWHHRFQKDSYPKDLPPLLHNYSSQTKELIQRYGRLLAIADSFDALHRLNDRNGFSIDALGEKIKSQMLVDNPDQRELILRLFSEGILTTQIF